MSQHSLVFHNSNYFHFDVMYDVPILQLYWFYLDEFLENFGFGLANVIDILDPDVIVLGGGLSNIDFLYTEGKDSVYGKVFSDLVDTPILKNKLGDSAGVFGAALLQNLV